MKHSGYSRKHKATPHTPPPAEAKVLDDAELEELREGLDDGSFHEIEHETWYRGLLATIDAIKRTIAAQAEAIAAVKALCDDAEAQAADTIARGGVVCIQTPEIRAAIEAAERQA